jgi:hypothetical protein
MMIDDDTLKQLLRINDEFFQLCKWLNERRDMEIPAEQRVCPMARGAKSTICLTGPFATSWQRARIWQPPALLKQNPQRFYTRRESPRGA